MATSKYLTRLIVVAFLGLPGLSFAEPTSANKTVRQAQASAQADARTHKESQQTFEQIAKVLRHPRCMNCHTVTEFPRQGDDRHRHQQLVMRGPANMGSPTMQCASCHQAQNSADGKIPGAPHWHLAPLSMAWEHLKTDKALCEAFVDKKKNGDRDTAKLLEHMTGDALVQWAWTPGDRKAPPISQNDFHRLVRHWASTGAACPDK